jgi:hypothetical protein
MEHLGLDEAAAELVRDPVCDPSYRLFQDIAAEVLSLLPLCLFEWQ